MEAPTQSAAQPETPKKTFSFGAMSNMKTSADQERPVEEVPPPEVVVTPVENTANNVSAAAKPVDEEDDLEIGAQLDDIPAEAPAPGAASQATVTPVAAPVVDTQPVAASPEPEPVSEQATEASLQNPDDPRLASLMGGGSQEAQDRAQERAATSGHGGRGGGPGLGAVIGAGIAGSFKMVGNGLKAARGHDASLPKPMGVKERRATRDPVSAQRYYDQAGDTVVREAIYRDSFNGMNSLLSEARAAEREFQDGVSRMNDFLHASPIKAMADQAQTSVGDYVHGVKSGTIKDAAALAIVQGFQQDNSFKAAENSIVSSAKTVKEKSEAALKKMNNIDVSFPGRLDTTMRKQQLGEMIEGMNNDDVAKVSDKINNVLDELSRLADMIKKIVVDFVQKVGTVLKPK